MAFPVALMVLRHAVWMSCPVALADCRHAFWMSCPVALGGRPHAVWMSCPVALGGLRLADFFGHVARLFRSEVCQLVVVSVVVGVIVVVGGIVVVVGVIVVVVGVNVVVALLVIHGGSVTAAATGAAGTGLSSCKHRERVAVLAGVSEGV